ncbi:hypothetical protein AVEN_146594-1 [Araneus ventricosus]|uniref:Uncharacterized protein n=1 Tax=Araneus ventricosus TaxID=182803 RepID=A0A4Y2MWI2_ARAVE|nr:hypothetical protein AVEN_146594-1 [Araneus ventricosus]
MKFCTSHHQSCRRLSNFVPNPSKDRPPVDLPIRGYVNVITQKRNKLDKCKFRMRLFSWKPGTPSAKGKRSNCVQGVSKISDKNERVDKACDKHPKLPRNIGAQTPSRDSRWHF